MKARKLQLGILVIAALLGGTGLALAQPQILVADIPFAFTLENATLPAGTYEIQQVDSWEFVLSDAKGVVKVAFVTEPAEQLDRASTGELIFNVSGDKYFFSKMWFPGAMDGFGLAKTRAERALMKMAPAPTKRVPLKKK